MFRSALSMRLTFFLVHIASRFLRFLTHMFVWLLRNGIIGFKSATKLEVAGFRLETMGAGCCHAQGL